MKKHFEKEDYWALCVMSFILALFIGVATWHGLFAEQFSWDSEHNFAYCHSDKNADEHQNSKECQGFIYKTMDDPVALFTGGLFIFTLVLAVVTFYLLEATKRGVRAEIDDMQIARDESKIAAETALAAVSAAQKQADTSRLVYEAEQRPWLAVTLTPISDLVWNDGYANITVRYEIKNTGRTPAIRCFCHVYLMDCVFRSFANDQKSIVDGLEEDFILGSTVFPGQTLIIERREISIRQRRGNPGLENMFSMPGVKQLVFLGCVRYKSTLTTDWKHSGVILEVFGRNPDSSRFAVNTEFTLTRSSIVLDSFISEQNITN